MRPGEIDGSKAARMTVQIDVREHLQTEITAPDPWQLSSNPFEHQRYALMLNMIAARGPFRRGLEVGCAGGFFTKFLLRHCKALHVVDLIPEALDRAAAHIGPHSRLTLEAASVGDAFAPGKTFDLIVVAEVLSYLPDLETVRRAVANLSDRLAPGGLLIFGSAVDATVARWGLTAGAETIMREWEKTMNQVDRAACVGSYWGENCLIAAYGRRDAPAKPGPDHELQEVSLIPYKAVRSLPAASVLVLAPHPDDETYGCGGAIIGHVEQGVPVRVITLSDGGGTLEGKVREAHVRERRDESREAAHVLGYGQPIFWDIPDRNLVYGEGLILRIMEALAGADLVYAPSLEELHPDHRAVAMATIEAVRRTGRGIRLALYEVSAPLRPNALIDISAAAPRKAAAMRCFGSQLQGQHYDQQVAALNRFRTYTLPAAVSAAEAFVVVSADELAREPLRFHFADNDRHQAEAAERALRRQLADLRNSTSWKVTAPLRAASRHLRAFLRGGPPFLTGPLRFGLQIARSAYHRLARAA